MNSSYVNMGVGALLATLFVLKSVSLASGFIFHSEAPEKPGFAIVATEEPAAGGDKGAAAKAETPIAQLLQKADAKAGEAIFKKCQACHSGEKGGPNKVGPDLWGIVDRPVAEHEGFAYSAGMKDFSKGGSEKWTYDHLYHFLAAPKKFVAGTAMGFAGLPKEEDRANVIAYLRTLADTQVPLPDPNAPAATN
ncbi:cysteine desulfurase [Rhizobium dioscoreae]|uniref:Cysteine desulfurase n=1 Tax=Rhizobium dioscoreae TaxID=2653122 RepID=A0ABQ0ZC50_9HYPH|nr:MULTISPECIES: cytochrome c family protein [Rhizobium]MCZ3380355.1 cytochrome c family protein [Rhizobium sp. AG207R]TWB08172.1 cytochrome c [Rhizobium sp. ERR1071]GES47085.1 cysteine desulfurase [Rhizobium dioscoreae]GES52973.1 cysteine desulfurase [Rhizobium dioscoreae]GLU84469.1 cysteine desulfurase [Rhizobium sp. NBRC 114257]